MSANARKQRMAKERKVQWALEATAHEGREQSSKENLERERESQRRASVRIDKAMALPKKQPPPKRQEETESEGGGERERVRRRRQLQSAKLGSLH